MAGVRGAGGASHGRGLGEIRLRDRCEGRSAGKQDPRLDAPLCCWSAVLPDADTCPGPFKRSGRLDAPLGSDLLALGRGRARALRKAPQRVRPRLRTSEALGVRAGHGLRSRRALSMASRTARTRTARAMEGQAQGVGTRGAAAGRPGAMPRCRRPSSQDARSHEGPRGRGH